MRISDWSSDVCSSDLLDRFGQALSVVVMDRQAKGARAPRDREADAPHADDAEQFSADAVAEHRARCPALPIPRSHQLLTLGQAARDAEEQGHRHVGSILGKDAGGVSEHAPLLPCRSEVAMIDPGTELGATFDLVARALADLSVPCPANSPIASASHPRPSGAGR